MRQPNRNSLSCNGKKIDQLESETCNYRNEGGRVVPDKSHQKSTLLKRVRHLRHELVTLGQDDTTALDKPGSGDINALGSLWRELEQNSSPPFTRKALSRITSIRASKSRKVRGEVSGRDTLAGPTGFMSVGHSTGRQARRVNLRKQLGIQRALMAPTRSDLPISSGVFRSTGE